MNQLASYIIALTNLYGIVTAEKVMEVYNHQNEEKVSIDELKNYLKNPPKKIIYARENLFVHEAVYYKKETPEKIYEDRKTLPYYTPEKEELLKYAEVDYFEKNNQYKQLSEYMETQLLEGDPILAEKIMTEVHDFLTEDLNNLKGALGVVEQYGISLENRKHISELINLIGDYAINLRLWDYNGYSFQESSAVMRKEAEKKQDNFKKLSLLEKYIISLTNLYGRVTKEKVMEIYNLQNENKIALEEVESYLNKSYDHFADHLVFIEHGEFLTEYIFIFEEEYHKLINEQAGKPFYIPDQEELFEYVDPHYVSYPKEFDKLVEYLEYHLYINDYYNAYAKGEDVQLALEMGDGLQGALYEITKDGYTFKIQQEIEDLADIITKLNNNTRMHINNGLTPRELSRVEKINRNKIKKIGRNDLCHCGSGKKYKKCCMLKDQKNYK